MLLAAEALREVATTRVTVDTPLGPADGRKIGADIVVVPVLRAGLGMLDAVLELVPNARVGHIGLQRDEMTAVASRYYSKLPASLRSSFVLMIDPMLATGGSAVAAIQLLREAGADADPDRLHRRRAGRHPDRRTALSERLDLHSRRRSLSERSQVHRSRTRRLRRPSLRHGLESVQREGLMARSHTRFQTVERRAAFANAGRRAGKRALTSIAPNAILIRGYPVDEMMGRLSFADAVYLLLMGELPPPAIGRMLNADPRVVARPRRHARRRRWRRATSPPPARRSKTAWLPAFSPSVRTTAATSSRACGISIAA